jgi:ABC-type proline/glycine betaine transport system permease subunit
MSGAEQRDIVDRDVSVGTFVGQGEGYYSDRFERIQKGTLPRWSMNIWGLVVPWLWAAWRGVWLMFWISLAIDVLALVCLMQVFKFSPLLAEAQLDASNNTTLIARYSGWITTYSWAALLLFVGGRLWMGSSANRWYFGQYARWRIDSLVPSGINAKRLVTGLVIIAIIAPLTTYRATQLRIDERACFNQMRAAEEVEILLGQYPVSNLGELREELVGLADTAQSTFNQLDAISDRTSSQNTARSAARGEARALNRNVETVEEYLAIDGQDRFDCFFIDDFPTLARLDPPEDVSYRRIINDEGEYEVIETVKDPVEGRKVNIFTYSAESIDISVNRLRAQYASFFDAMTNILRQSLIRVEVAFMQTPWPVVAFLFLALSWAFAGRGTTIFVASSLGFLALFELWQIAMQTMALVVVSTAICVFVGLPLGIWMAKNKLFRWITEPILDVMQTIPSLSYLVPAVAFFGISQPPAVLATVIFAIPPMVKLTALGIRQVPESTKEAALAFGASERQLLRKVELPMAVPSIMAGLNQTIMLALSMATISAFIGAEGLGALVTASLGDAQAGKGLLAGLAIALVAMMIDRILRGIRESFSRI